MKHINISIKGKVQGVYFRLTTKAVADQLGIKGFVTNLPDGSVYVEAEGDKFSLDSLIEFCEEGPERAEVEHVSIEDGELKNFHNFEVTRKIK
ncbi:acylphosphatase [Sphingobacterium sp. SYP-B4668]|uniref:acylphosphatase n=1 Tax=Sphingobacterium sp. SYP-B4668 TaxID=2996035 RepID=UPI0022DD4B9E|nr:acylphosphatase [Sphingobacterium sp. SYP-B4668]